MLSKNENIQIRVNKENSNSKNVFDFYLICTLAELKPTLNINLILIQPVFNFPIFL